MQLALEFTNELTASPIVGAMLDEALSQLPVARPTVDALRELALNAVRDAVEHAYPKGEEGSIKLTVRRRRSKLEILIRDYGMPQDIATLERRFHKPRTFDHKVVDELHWRSFGADGKEFQIVKWLDTENEIQHAGIHDYTSLENDVPEAPQQDYLIQRMVDKQTVQVSQLMYRAYGNTYFNEDVYYPERLATQNAEDKVLSFVALSQDGDVVGHYALELNQDGPVAEGGQAVVHPAHRGRGLLDRMRDAAIQEAHRLELVGWFADAVCVHTRTQQSHVTHGGHLTAVDLGIAPRSERFRKIADDQPQRVTCLLYFHWLREHVPRTIYVPPRHQDVVSKIYENLQCKIRFGQGESPTGHGRLMASVDSGAGKAIVRVEELGADTVWSIRHAKREFVERSHAEVVFVDLPAEKPATPTVVNALETEGFGFVGVAPHFSACGDMLRLVYLVEPLAREPIKTFQDFADYLVQYALSEQTRVIERL